MLGLGGGTNDDWANSLVKASDGGYVITGTTYSYSTGNDDAFIAKYTADGSLSWSRTWGGTGSDWANSLIQTGDGGYMITGGTHSYGAGGTDAFMAKYTADGSLSWSRTWGGTNDDLFGTLIQTSDNGYAVTGNTYSYGVGGNEAFIAKYTADGSIDSCPLWMCQSPAITATSPSVTITNPVATVTSPLATTLSPTATTTSPAATTLNAIPTPPPPITLTFSSQELYVAYPGVSTTTCKEWTAPSGKQIKGFLVSQETESSYDFFTVSLDGTEKYKRSGNQIEQYTDTSSTPGSMLKACMSADSSGQSGYGGQVTGVIYN